MFNNGNGGYSLSDIAAITGNRNDGFGNGDGWWIILILLFAMNGWGWDGNNSRCGGGGYTQSPLGGPAIFSPWVTQADVRSAVDQQTLTSKLDQQTYGLADSTYALNTAIMNGFHGVDNAICTLGYQTQEGFTSLGNQLASCCCDTRAAIKDSVTQGAMNTNQLATQIANGFCDVEKSNMQNRFDAQAYNCSTLQAIDKLGDRIIDFMTQDKIADLTAENQSLKFAASTQAQNAFITANQQAQTAELIRRLEQPCPVPAYFVPNPNAVYNYGCGAYNTCQCGC